MASVRLQGHGSSCQRLCQILHRRLGRCQQKVRLHSVEFLTFLISKFHLMSLLFLELSPQDSYHNDEHQDNR